MANSHNFAVTGPGTGNLGRMTGVPATLPALLPPEVERLLTPELRETLRAFMKSAGPAMSKAWAKAMRADGRLFAGWCEDRGLPWLPAPSQAIADFIADVGRNRAPASIQRYLASIAAWHAGADLPNPCATKVVQFARKAQARLKGIRQVQAEPLGEREIEEIVADIELGGAADLVDQRDRALLLVARDSLARAAELTALLWKDLRPAGGGDDDPDRVDGATILIRRAKNDPLGRGRIAWLAPETMAALEAWRRALEAAIEPATGMRPAPSPFIFRHLANRGYGTEMSPQAVALVAKRRAATIGLFLGRYSAHSTRVGACQDLVARGEDLPAIMQAGGFKTATMIARYAERLLAERGAVARARRQKRGKRPARATDENLQG